MGKFSVLATFGFINESQKEIDSVTSTFSLLSANIENADQSGSEFFKTLKNLNINTSNLKNNIEEISNLTPTADLVVKFDDPQNILEKVENIDNKSIQIQTTQIPASTSSETPIAIKASAESAIATAALAVVIAAFATLSAPVSIPTIGLSLVGTAVTSFILSYVSRLDEGSVEAIPELSQEQIDNLPPLKRELILIPNLEEFLDTLPLELLIELNKDEISPEAEQQIREFIGLYKGEIEKAINQEEPFKGPIKLPDITDPIIMTDPKEIEEFYRKYPELKELFNDNNQSLLNLINTQDAYATSTNNTNGAIDRQTDSTNALGVEVATIGSGFELVTNTQRNYNEEAKQTEKTIGKLDKRTEDVVDTSKSFDKQIVRNVKGIKLYDENLQQTDATAQQLGENGLPKIKEGAETAGEGIMKAAEDGKNSLNSLGVFAGNIATNIADSFSGFISTAIKGDFDGIEDLWDNLLDSLQDKTEENQQNVVNLDEFREKRGEIHQIDENEQEFRLAA